MTSPAEAATQASTLAALQARGAPQLDPVGWCHIQALARRAAAHQGATRRLLDDKLARLVELKAVRNYRSTWSRLKVDQRMAQLQAKVPGNAGPLNTHKLLHEALTLMRDASPQYLQQFMAQVDALLWLDQAGVDGEARTRR